MGYRIKVRGEFKGLTPEQRADLLAEAAEHDPMTARFTAEGHVAYELAARPFFTFRRSDDGEDEARATARTEEAARQWLQARGLEAKLISTSVEDLSAAPQGSRQRRVARRELGGI